MPFDRTALARGLAALTLVGLSVSLAVAQPPPPTAGQEEVRRRPGGNSPGSTAAGNAAPVKAPVLVSFAPSEDRWVWLVSRGDEATLYLGGADGAGREMAKGPGWKEAVLAGDRVWLLQVSGNAGQLVSLPVAGGPPSEVASGLKSPAALATHAGRVYWLEYDPAALPAFTHIPAASGRTVLNARDPDGAIHRLGEWHGAQAPGRGDLVFGSSQVYVRLRRVMATEFYRVDLASGDNQRVVVEEGTQECLVAEGEFYWTAPSEEASFPTGMRSVRRRSPNGSIHLVTDWLPANGTLLGKSREVYYAGDKLYRLPSNLGEARQAGSLPLDPIVSDGRQWYLLNPASGPSVLKSP